MFSCEQSQLARSMAKSTLYQLLQQLHLQLIPVRKMQFVSNCSGAREKMGDKKQLQNKLQSCSSVLIQATRSFVTAVWPGNHPHIILCNVPGVHSAPGTHCPRDLSLTCVTSSFTAWNSLTMLQHCIQWLIFKNSVNKIYHSLFLIWLALWKGKMNPIVHCDWLPERVRWRYLSRSGFPAVSCKKIDSVLFPYIMEKEHWILKKSFIHQACLVKMACYCIGLIHFCKFVDPNYISFQNTQKQNLANIELSCRILFPC